MNLYKEYKFKKRVKDLFYNNGNLEAPTYVKGPQGDKGNLGPEGDPGPASNEQGAKGLDGMKGPRGYQGPRGETGDKGVQGDKGPTGDPGVVGGVNTALNLYKHRVTFSNSNAGIIDGAYSLQGSFFTFSNSPTPITNMQDYCDAIDNDPLALLGIYRALTTHTLYVDCVTTNLFVLDYGTIETDGFVMVRQFLYFNSNENSQFTTSRVTFLPNCGLENTGLATVELTPGKGYMADYQIIQLKARYIQ